ncbi:MAG: ABC transporter permease subunit/CPBP intramembrane protease [Planctomycetota bacterium]
MNHLRRLRRRAAEGPRLSAVWLIYAREMRDQLRDRRTLFTIAVLPILLYPLVGTLLLQIAQFTRQQPTSVCLVGFDTLEDGPKLLSGESIDPRWLEPGSDASRWNLATFSSDDLDPNDTDASDVRSWVRDGAYDVAVVHMPATDGSKLNIDLLYNVASDQSNVAKSRVEAILNRWQAEWIRMRLDDRDIDMEALNPFTLTAADMAPEQTREAAFWSKLLPFVMLVWAMTGAFYPAIDLVAGEKERGTLETILCSPALRGEIVWGKLAAVTTFSMLTAVLNASSMLLTSSFVFKQIQLGGGGAMGTPPLVPMLWLLVALVPLSALFSALALAVAAMARSSKEGQYYLMPLMMVTLPLVMLPMLPGTTLTIGTSVIPVTGMFLLVRALVEGQFALALFHLPIVVAVTATCLHLALTWARRQFENESVLFGGGEQWELGRWVKHLWRDRQIAATPGQGFACGAIILVGLFFGKLAVTSMPDSLAGIAKLIVMPQIGLILAPALLMATMLTTSLRQSLRIRMTAWTTLPLAVLLGITLHPSYVLLTEFVKHLYPISPEALASMKPFVDQIASAPWWTVVFLMAVIPAICEELAFRGFIFGGLVRGQGRFRAVLISAALFGISHGILQQSISASVMGLLLGWVTLRTGSVLPCMLIHVTSNALSVSLPRIAESNWAGASLFLKGTGDDLNYQPLWIAISIPVAITILLYFAATESSTADEDADRLDIEPTIADPSIDAAPKERLNPNKKLGVATS